MHCARVRAGPLIADSFARKCHSEPVGIGSILTLSLWAVNESKRDGPTKNLEKFSAYRVGDRVTVEGLRQVAVSRAIFSRKNPEEFQKRKTVPARRLRVVLQRKIFIKKSAIRAQLRESRNCVIRVL